MAAREHGWPLQYGIVEAAAFVAESRTVKPGTWPNGIYVGKDFMTVCMFAREQQGAEFAAQSENGTVNADVPARPPTPAYPTTPANGIDLNSLAGELAQLAAEDEPGGLDVNEPDDVWQVGSLKWPAGLFPTRCARCKLQ